MSEVDCKRARGSLPGKGLDLMPVHMRRALHEAASATLPQQDRHPGLDLCSMLTRRPASRPNPRPCRARAAPRRRGLSLGLRLGLIVTLIVAGAMTGVTATQLTLDLRSELRERQSLLAASLSPLVAQLRTAATREDAEAAVQRFHFAYLDGGHAHHYLAILDSDGRVPAASGAQGAEPALLTSSVPLVAPAFAPWRVELLVTQDSSRFHADRSRRWRSWAVHVGLTALVMLSLLFVVIPGARSPARSSACSGAFARWSLVNGTTCPIPVAPGSCVGWVGVFTRWAKS